MNSSEVQRFVEEAKPFAGARLQDVQSTDRMLALGLYHDQVLYWWIIDLKPALPLILISTELPKFLKNKTTPLQLFLKAHFVGHRLRNIKTHESADRVLVLEFPDRVIEVRLFPHGQNVIARTYDKTLSWSKVERLKNLPLNADIKYSVRSNHELAEEWLSSMQARSEKSEAQDLQKIIAKKTSALEEMQKNIDSDEHEQLYTKGVSLQSKGQIKEAQLAFEKAKKIALKKEGAIERVHKLKLEIALLEKGEVPKKIASSKIIEKSEAKARRILIAEKYELLIGKSGADNLKLLRRANSHDYWLHLKDYPGAHGILHRNKMKEISDSDLREALKRFVKESMSSKASFKEGDPVDVVICECRFVRPIKGDKLGRVSYKNERVICIRF